MSSRAETFAQDNVLQENIILLAKRKNNENEDSKVVISFSNNSSDLNTQKARRLPLHKVINFSSKNKVVFLPTSEEDDRILSTVNSWKGNLHKYEMEISTGKVVPFRSTEYLLDSADITNGAAPLIWINSIQKFGITWPSNRKNKPQYIRVSKETSSLLNKNGNYVLLRRFSSKEEERRLNSAPFLENKLRCNFVAFENHVNYIHRPQGKFSKAEAIGLSAVLNSVYLDTYFRISNGNTQVSATEIRDLPLPDLSIIKRIGEIINSGSNINVDDYLSNNH
jgi:adenine-specific DNA-methyltransferase